MAKPGAERRRTLSAQAEQFALARPFRIARGVKTSIEVVTVHISADGATGRGEGVPYPRYGETVAAALAAIAGVGEAIAQGADRHDLLQLLPAGAARNAVDCALWDLELRQQGRRLRANAAPLPTAVTISLDTPATMQQAAAALAQVPLLKVKVDRSAPEAQLRAVRHAAPAPRLIVDPNESWTMAEVERLQPLLQELRVDLLEQPLPAGEDAALQDFCPLVPIAADESVHGAADVEALAGRYQVINIKLDKSGGLTAAMQLAEATRAHGLQLMTGCMVSTSLSIVPLLPMAATAAFVDLDGPWWLAQDRAGGVRCADGRLYPPAAGFWGN